MTRAKEKAKDELTGFMMLELDQAGSVAESKAMRKLLTTAMKLAQLDASGILTTRTTDWRRTSIPAA
ncbi:MAG: hypothetical protein ACOCWR_11140 [Oceanidesulfovibrio sp.]